MLGRIKPQTDCYCGHRAEDVVRLGQFDLCHKVTCKSFAMDMEDMMTSDKENTFTMSGNYKMTSEPWQTYPTFNLSQ